MGATVLRRLPPRNRYVIRIIMATPFAVSLAVTMSIAPQAQAVMAACVRIQDLRVSLFECGLLLHSAANYLHMLEATVGPEATFLGSCPISMHVVYLVCSTLERMTCFCLRMFLYWFYFSDSEAGVSLSETF